MNWFLAAGRGCAARRFQARPVALAQLQRVLDAAAQFPAGAGLRGIVVSAADARLPARRAVFGRAGAGGDAAPVAIVWYLDEPADPAGRPRDPGEPAGRSSVCLAWPSPQDTIAAGEAIGFAVLAAAAEGLASAVAPRDGRLVKRTLGLPPSATVMAVLLIGYPDTIDGDTAPASPRFFWKDTETPFDEAPAGASSPLRAGPSRLGDRDATRS